MNALRVMLGLVLALILGVQCTPKSSVKPAKPESPGTDGPVAEDEILSNGITWTLRGGFAKGQFVTGDWWVVGPLTVASVSPGWDGEKNGSMINPAANSAVQGYDNRGMQFKFDETVRVQFPLEMQPGQSLISTIGKQSPTSGGGASRISRAAVLTVVSKEPASDAFRPPFVGSAKPLWVTRDVNYSMLPSLTLPLDTKLIELGAANNYINSLWLTHGNQLTWHAQIHPEEQMGGTAYPASLGEYIGHMAVASLLNIPQAESIANRLIQYGIDLQAQMDGNGMTWSQMGGFGLGRKYPILFANAMLSANWKVPYYVSGTGGIEKFQEDANTYIGVDEYGFPVPRWGAKCDVQGYPGSAAASNHTCRASKGDEDQWKLVSGGKTAIGGYEHINAQAFVGVALAARIMQKNAGLMTAWAHAPFFDYVDRWVEEIADDESAAGVFKLGNDFQVDANKYGGTGNGFMKRMWETYR